jgi:CheY-like chemotaxis protein
MANDSVLIVEDTPVNLKVMRVLLSRQGFDVRTATTAEERLLRAVAGGIGTTCSN